MNLEIFTHNSRETKCRRPYRVLIPVAERFWSKVQDRDDPMKCWNFSGCQIKGYGQFPVKINGKIEKRAHRISWILTNRALIPDGKQILHRCDNPRCCNPSHLFLGTPHDNNLDMRAKNRGRYVNGERHGRCTKLSQSKVEEIRRLHSGQKGQKAKLAKQFGITKTHIARVLDGKVWRQ